MRYIKKLIPITKDQPFQEGEEYNTKFQTGDKFLITKIITKNDMIIRFEGYYTNSQHLGVCPINPDRLISKTKIIDDFIEICKCCGKEK